MAVATNRSILVDMAPNYHTEIDPEYGSPVALSPLIRRVVCENPGRFTYTGTGTYLIGRGQVAVIDPGPNDDEHVAALLSAVSGEQISHIVITHTHGDHSPAAAPLQAATGAPTYGFGPHPAPTATERARARPTTWDALMPTRDELEELKKSMPKRDAKQSHAEQEEPSDAGFSPDVVLAHGDVIQGGEWSLEAVHTPGHISNHMCFGLGEEDALFVGDHVMGWSTTVVPQPDGSMADYMASLDLLLQRADRTYYPTHGPPIPEPHTFVRQLIAHRLDRERQLLDCLVSGPKSIPQMVTAMYSDTTPHILHMAAGQSVLSQLLWLVEKGRVSTEGRPTADSVFHLAMDAVS